jgi:hypothetical protein
MSGQLGFDVSVAEDGSDVRRLAEKVNSADVILSVLQRRDESRAWPIPIELSI